ncbi:LysE family translocator [Silvimonas iriomotensis]|uniref:Lysine transporter LysE n=1 Tax=Silvimonas iriomotensis TaxID=449662 RepID=A0ABQ2PEM9_9NEIS|nr:LysE family translocator [Silvimonas iriomotensis]GGP24019.1 lysine transporter LysE [Silvimonas iriomotensis]
MSGIHSLTLFVLSGLLLNIAPGPDSFYIVTRSVTQGFRAGSAAALGIGAGTMVHIFAAAFGLSAVLATSAAAFTVVKLIGAAYLLYVGVGMLRSRSNKAATAETTPVIPPAPLWAIFRQGFWTNVLNPKVALFFLAFVPQFINTDAPHTALSFVILGLIFNFNGMLWCHFLALTAHQAARRLRGAGRFTAWLNRVMGGVFVYLGVKLALVQQR